MISSVVVFDRQETGVVYDDTQRYLLRSSGVIRGLSEGGGERLPEGGKLVTVDEPTCQNSEKS